MNRQFLIVLICSLSIGYGRAHSFGAAPQPAPGKSVVETKDYLFGDSKDEIVAKAKQEGKLEVLTFLEADTKKAMVDAFTKKYPFIQVSTGNIGGIDEYRRFIPEMKLGRAKRWDVVHISNQVYSEYPPYLKKFDVLRMAEKKVLNIPPPVVDYNYRNIVAKSTQITVAAYNSALISQDKVPAKWEDFLRPEFKGRKFMADIRPLTLANLVPVWGLEKALEFGRRLAEQKPIWSRGSSRALTSLTAGEYPLIMGINLGSVLEVQAKDPTKRLQVKLVEPLPVRFGAAEGILATAVHPYAGLLWMEFQVSPEAQEILDKHGLGDGSALIPGSYQEKLMRGKPVSMLGWDLHQNLDEWSKKIVEAYGFR
jgi:iron(III) transport system substrate-binding protein